MPPACGDVTADESCLWYGRVFYFAHWSPAEGVKFCQEGMQERNPITDRDEVEKRRDVT